MTTLPPADAAPDRERLLRFALALALLTIVLSVAEALVSTWFGGESESVTLFGFGLDSFIEAISGLGVAHMIVRMRRRADGDHDAFERLALRITGGGFYALIVVLLAGAAYHLATAHAPRASLPGVVIASGSILAMAALMAAKTRVGTRLGSRAILADARCTRVCIAMSLVLLASSGIFALTRIGAVDALGAIGLAWFSWKEGRECFESARRGACACGDAG